MGVFIQISLEPSEFDLALGRSVVSACPVDIFALQKECLVVRPDVEDECTLCELCLDLAPSGALTIHKLYKPESLTARGQRHGGSPANGSLPAASPPG